MTLKKLTYLLIIFTLFSFASDEAFARSDMDKIFSKDSPVQVDADSIEYERGGSRYLAVGNVKVTQGNIELVADRVEVDMEAGLLKAMGHLRVTDEGGNLLKADFFDMEIETKNAVLVNGTLFFKKNNVYIKSDAIKKTGPETYELGLTSFTSCDCAEGKSPAWSITTKRSTVSIGEYFKGWNAKFRVKDKPVLYLPYVKIPVKRERQTGFLMPGPGYSNLRGVKLDNAFFWAITPSMDATLFFDYESKRGVGPGLEFRHFRTPHSYSEFHFNYYRERDIDRVRVFREDVENLSRPLSAGLDRWQLKFQHDETLSHGLKLRADINLVSDDEYFIDFMEDDDERSIESLESTISLTKNWSSASLVVEFRWFDNLLDERDREVLKRLPEITYTMLARKLGSSHLYLSLDSSFVNFVKKEGYKGQRLDIEPRISLPMRPYGFFELTPSIAPRWTKYRVEDAGSIESPERFIYEFRTDLLTTFARSYAPPKKIAGPLRHTIRPGLSYIFVPDQDQSELFVFDGIDRIEAVNELSFSLNSTLSYRYMEDKILKRHELLYLNLEEGFDLREVRKDVEGTDEEQRPLSDFSAEIRFSPMPEAEVVADMDYDLYESRFNRYDTSFRFTDRKGDDLYLSYRFDRSLDTRYIEGHARVWVTNSWGVSFKQRYSFDEDRSLEANLALEYLHQCYGARVSIKESPEERLILLDFSLKGMGEVLGFSEGL